MHFTASVASVLAVSFVYLKPAHGAETFYLPVDTGGAARLLFESTCVACHGDDGKGEMPGVPDITGAGGPLTKPDSVLIRRMLDGFQRPGSPMAMPPKGGNPALTEQDAAKLVDYMRSTFKP